MSKKFSSILFFVFVFCKLLPTVFADRQYYGMDAIVKADTSSGMGGSGIDVKEIDRRVNAFASIVGEEQFNLIVGGTLLARSAFYGQQRDVASDVLAPRMSVESTDPREHIEVGSVRHEIVQEEHSRQDNSFTIPIGDLFTVMSRLTPKEQLAKVVFEQEKTAGASNAEAREVVTETKKIAEVAEKADQKVAIKQKQAAVKLRQVLVEKSPDLAMKTFSMDDAELFVFMSEYSQYHLDSISSEFLMLDAIFQRQQQQIYADAQRQFEAMSLSEKARHYALAAKDATVEYTSEFADDPLGHSKDLALGTAYFAGDLITPGGLDAPTRFIKGETSFGQMLADQSISVGIEGATGLAVGKVFKVGKRLGTALVKGEKVLQKAIVAKIAERSGHVHKNSLAYRGDTHVYKIIGEDGVYKIGESAQGLNKTQQSIRATQQARKLERQTKMPFKTEIIETFPGKLEARAFETQLIRDIRVLDPKALPGNKGVH